MVHSTSNKCRRRGIVSPQKMVPSRSRRYNPKRVRFASDLATTSPSAADRTATQIRWCAKTTKTRCTFSLENRKALWWDDRSLAQSRCESRALAEQYESSPYQAALWFLWQTPWCHGGNIAVSSSFWLRHSLHWLVACSDLRGLEQRVCPSLKLFRLRSSRAVLRLQHELRRQRQAHCRHCIVSKQHKAHQASIPSNLCLPIEHATNAPSSISHHDCRLLQNDQKQGCFLLRCASLQTSRAAGHLAYRLAQADQIEALRIYQEDKMLLAI
jgi:hypothetical protein